MGNKFILRSMLLPIIHLGEKTEKNNLYINIITLHVTFWHKLICKGENSQDYIIYTIFNYFIIYLCINLNLQINRDALIYIYLYKFT